jgi:hypothetical protein
VRKQTDAEKARKVITRSRDEATAVDFFGATAYIDQKAAIEVFAYTRIKSPEIVNGVVPVRVPRSVVLAYLKNFPVAK